MDIETYQKYKKLARGSWGKDFVLLKGMYSGMLNLLREEEDKKRIIVDSFVINDEEGSVLVWVDKEPYFSASMYVIDTLRALEKNGIKFPFGVNLVRKESSKSGNIYYDLRP